MRRTIILVISLALGVVLSFGCSGGGSGDVSQLEDQDEKELQNEVAPPKTEEQPCFDNSSCGEGLICLLGKCVPFIEPVILPPDSIPDETPPAVTVKCPEASLSNKDSGEISFSADKDADLYCSIDDSLFDKCSSPFSFSGISDGNHIFRVYAVGTNQITSETLLCTWASDITKPEIVQSNVADNSFVPSLTKNFIFDFSEPIKEQGQVKLKSGGTEMSGGGSLSENAMQYTFISRGAGLADGQYSLYISGFTDDADNVMDDVLIQFTVDDVMPSVQLVCPVKTITNIKSGAITFMSKENVQFFCKLDGSSEAACASPFSYSNLVDGKHTFELSALSDTQKKTSGGTCAWAVDSTPPKVTATDPANTSVVNVGTAAFKLNFSEPVAQVGIVTIGSSAYAVPGSGTLSSDKMSYTFTTNSGELKFGNYTITAKGFKDAAGNIMADHSSAFTAKLVPNPMLPNGAWKANLAAGVHPRVFGNKARLLELKAKKPNLFENIKSSVAHFDPNIEFKYYFWTFLNPNILKTDAVVYATTGQSEYIDKIREIILRIITDPVYNSINPLTKMNPFNDHESTYMKLMNVAIAYDMYQGAFSDAERKLMIEYMNKHLGVFTVDESPFSSANLNYKIYAYLLAAYATWNENPKARDLRDYAIKTMYEGKLVPVLLVVGEGGAGAGEGGWYERGFMPKLMENLELARLLEGYDGYEKAPNFFYSKLAYEMNDTYPGKIHLGESIWERYPEEGDGALFNGGADFYSIITRTSLAEYYHGTELARQIANKNAFLTPDQITKQEPPVQLYFYLYSNAVPEEPISISGMPLAHLASGEGRIYARSSWADDASFLRFECGPYFAQHQHLEVGNFEIYRNAHLATESGAYGFGGDMGSLHWVDWYARTIAHNSMLVFDPNEFMHNYTYYKYLADGGQNRTPNGQWSFYGNEGGQSIKRNIWIDTMDGWLAKKGFLAPPITFYNFAGGTIVGYENTPQYMFAACDGTAAYEPDKMAKWIREIVFIRPHTFVILDRVVSTKAELPKTWLIHSVNQPVMDDASRSFTITKDAGTLYGKTLLPDKATMTPILGYKYGGNEYPLVKVVPSNYVVGKWRIEVSPATANKEDIFLHVLSTDKAPNAKLIANPPAGTIGVKVDGTEVYFKDDVGGTVKIGNTIYPIENKVKKNKYE